MLLNQDLILTLLNQDLILTLRNRDLIRTLPKILDLTLMLLILE